jgi:hypothetical protein
VDSEYFKNECIRFGRVITLDENHSWKWNGYSFGVDLVWSIIDHCVIVKRQRSAAEMIPQASPRNVMIK